MFGSIISEETLSNNKFNHCEVKDFYYLNNQIFFFILFKISFAIFL